MLYVRQIGSSPQGSGVKIKKMLETTTYKVRPYKL